MKYLNENKEFVGWKPIITILLGTGMRIGECLGLRWEDLDFDARTIDVNHNLVYRRIEDGISKGMIKHINTPKTVAGNRKIPMLQDVYDAFLEEYQFQRITNSYNAQETKLAREEKKQEIIANLENKILIQ